MAWIRAGKPVAVYCRDERRGTRECGALDLDAPEAQLQALMTEVEALPAEDCGCVGLYRDDHDYVEISSVGNGEYFFWSDRLTRRPGWFGWLRRGGPWDRILAGRDEAMTAFRAYCESSREAFEQRYG